MRRPPSNTPRTRPAHTAFSATRPRTSSTPTSGRLPSSARRETGCARRLTFDTIAPHSLPLRTRTHTRCDAAQARTREDAVGLAPDHGAGANHKEEEVAADFRGEGAVSLTTVSRPAETREPGAHRTSPQSRTQISVSPLGIFLSTCGPLRRPFVHIMSRRQCVAVSNNFARLRVGSHAARATPCRPRHTGASLSPLARRNNRR